MASLVLEPRKEVEELAGIRKKKIPVSQWGVSKWGVVGIMVGRVGDEFDFS
jgi:hypothetical protein